MLMYSNNKLQYKPKILQFGQFKVVFVFMLLMTCKEMNESYQCVKSHFIVKKISVTWLGINLLLYIYVPNLIYCTEDGMSRRAHISLYTDITTYTQSGK